MSKISIIQLYNTGFNNRKSAKIVEKRLEFTNFKRFLIKKGYHLQNFIYQYLRFFKRIYDIFYLVYYFSFRISRI